MARLRRRAVGHTEAEQGCPQAVPIAQLQARRRATVVGQVVHMRAVPTSGLPNLLVTVHDASGNLTVRWSGRRAIGGVGLGRRLRVDGMVVDSGGRLEMLNPVYTLMP